MSKRRGVRFKLGPFAHGSVGRCIFEKEEEDFGYKLQFPTTVASDIKYPVAFYGLVKIKKLYQWLGEQIAVAESVEASHE